MAGGGAAPPPKQEELQPHPVKDQLPSVSYCITSPPPWRTSLSPRHPPTYLGLLSSMSEASHVCSVLCTFGIYVLVMWIFPFDVDAILLGVGHWVWAAPDFWVPTLIWCLPPSNNLSIGES